MASETDTKPVKKWKPRYVPQSDAVPSLFAANASSKPLKFKSTTTRKWTPKKPSSTADESSTPAGVPASFAAAYHPNKTSDTKSAPKRFHSAPASKARSPAAKPASTAPAKKWNTGRTRPIPPPVNRAVEPPAPVAKPAPEPPKEAPRPATPPPAPEPAPAPAPEPAPVVQAPPPPEPAPKPAPTKSTTISPVSPKKPSKFAVSVPEAKTAPKYVPKHAPESPPKAKKKRNSVRIENIADLPITTDGQKVIDLLKDVCNEANSLDSHQDSIDNPPSQTSSQAEMEDKMRKLLREQGLHYSEHSVSVSSASSSDSDSVSVSSASDDDEF